MNTECLYFTGANGVRLPARIWTPDYHPCMVLQITHGMTEHIGRYENLAKQLTAYGIAVAGFDLRGHGLNESKSLCASFGEGGWKASLHDMYLFYMELESRFAGVPHFMLGFSLGSFLLRDFLSNYEKKPDGAIIMGTGHQPRFILSALMRIIKREIKSYGFDNHTSLVDRLSFGSYNQKFPQSIGYFDWLCSDKNQLAVYSADKFCRRHISAGLFYQLLDAMKRTSNTRTYKKWDKEMPVILLSGEKDPVGDFGKGVQRVRADMDKAGVQNIQMYFLPDSRHDVFHEVDSRAAGEAIDILTSWLFEQIGGKAI